MRFPRMLTVVVVAAFASSVSFAGNATPKQDNRQDNRLEEGLVPLPHPITPPPETGASSSVIGSGFQLVGFTTQTFDGSRGILNLTLACQNEIPASRICTADDVRLTINVPQAPGAGFAWIDVPPSRELQRTRVDEAANCRGWRSSASADSGMAMDLDAAYGSFVHRTCDQALRVACCAGN